MKITEATIRDALASRLEVLETGLELVEVEHKIPSPYGAFGRIDILAKDRFGNRVIIEIKRSDQSARQALHEVFKYVALFSSHSGLPSDKLRCFVVSTAWHELRVPFSELVNASIFQIHGFRLTIDEDGRIISAEPVKPVKADSPISLFRHHNI